MPTSARKDGANFVYSIGPDVCLTPMGGTMVPVAYNSIAFFDRVDRSITTVRNNGDEDFVVNSRPALCTGHEAGTGKGVKVPGYKSHAVVTQGANGIYAGGWAVVRDGDAAELNRPGPGGVESSRSQSTTTIEHA